MTTIYLIRHAEAEGNVYRVYQGQHDTLLTETGKLQAQALGERFRDVHVDAVYSSDLYRAAATAAVDTMTVKTISATATNSQSTESGTVSSAVPLLVCKKLFFNFFW